MFDLKIIREKILPGISICLFILCLSILLLQYNYYASLMPNLIFYYDDITTFSYFIVIPFLMFFILSFYTSNTAMTKRNRYFFGIFPILVNILFCIVMWHIGELFYQSGIDNGMIHLGLNPVTPVLLFTPISLCVQIPVTTIVFQSKKQHP